ncbi:hypothetical protein BH11PSE1_BH11PSE1_21860 [soil metagenome]
MPGNPFGEKLELVLKVLSLSRGRLAAGLKVDKSVVGRWASGAVTPSTHNLALLTHYIADRLPGFTMLAWDREMAEFATLVGADLPRVEPNAVDGLPVAGLAEIREATLARGGDLEGFFETTRTASRAPGLFFHDQCLVRRHDDNGLLEIRLGMGEVVFTGWALPIRNHICCITTEAHTGAMTFIMLNCGVVQRPTRLDGIVLGAAAGAPPGLVATPIVCDRVGDLTGDRDADEAAFRERLARNPVASQNTVPPEVVAQLTRTFGPEQLALGGELQMHFPFHVSLTR